MSVTHQGNAKSQTLSGREQWLRIAQGWRVPTSYSAGVKRQDTEGFENSSASYRFPDSLQHSSHDASFQADAGLG